MAVKKGKRELLDTGTDKRYVKRNQDGGSKSPLTWGGHSRPIGVATRRSLQSQDTGIRGTRKSARQRRPQRRDEVSGLHASDGANATHSR
jgi:hypothetical protein